MNNEHLCDTCSFHPGECMPDRVVYGINRDPSARGADADKVLECNGYYCKKPWIGVDFDGTLVVYDEWQGAGVFGAPIRPMIDRVKHWLKCGRRIKIVTARAHDPIDSSAVKAWTLEHLGQELEVTAEKDYLMLQLWDDRAVQLVPNTGICAVSSLPARISELEAESSKRMRALESLTPTGSEFYNDVDACVAFVRAKTTSLFDNLKKAIIRAKAAEKECDETIEALKVIRDAVSGDLRASDSTPTGVLAAILGTVNRVLDHHPSEEEARLEAKRNYLRSDPMLRRGDDMDLPPDRTCADCVHIKRCTAIYGHIPEDEARDWSPFCFQPK